MAKTMTMRSHLGTVNLLGQNPRTIRDGAFSTLCESLERDEEFLNMRGIVVWQVPTRLEVAEGEKSPFSGQEGKIVVIGGNMRVAALSALGHDELKREWVVEAKDGAGNWISPEKAERFVLMDNSPAGLGGSNDYEKMLESFNEMAMRQTGIDFSEFQVMITAGTVEPLVGTDEDGKTDEDRAEEDSLMGEKSDELKDFIAEREKTRDMLKEIDEFGFHLVLVFEDVAEKADFISKAKVFGGTVAVDGSGYLDLVFESYGQKADFLDRSGLRDVVTEDGLPALMYGMFCDGRAFAKKMGVELAETGLHFRDRIVDNQLKGLAMEPMEQKSEAEIQEEIFAKLKAERKELGMSTGRGGGTVKGKGRSRKGMKTSDDSVGSEAGDGLYVSQDAFE